MITLRCFRRGTDLSGNQNRPVLPGGVFCFPANMEASSFLWRWLIVIFVIVNTAEALVIARHRMRCTDAKAGRRTNPPCPSNVSG